MSIIPSNLPLENEVKPLPDSQVLWLDKDSTIYAKGLSDQSQLKKSTNWGESWENLFRFSGSPLDRVQVLGDNSIIAQTRDGTIWRSEDSGSSFSVAFAPNNGSVSFWGGLDAYDKFVFFAPYTRATEVKAYMSNDYGKEGSWKEILHIDKGVTHIHDIRFDPYENLIWVACGDHRPADIILFSDDFGTSWQKNSDEQYYRCTNIMPLPDSVFFGTDESFITGVYKHERPLNGTTQTEVKPDLYWASKKNNEDGAPVHWATRPAITYGANGKAYWGYLQSSSNPSLPAQIYSTDGNKVFPVWTQERHPVNEPANIYAVFGPDDSGNIVADLKSPYTVDEKVVDTVMVRVKVTN